VIERKRQRHAHPEHAGRDFHRVAGLGKTVGENVIQLLFERVHAGTVSGLSVVALPPS